MTDKQLQNNERDSQNIRRNEGFFSINEGTQIVQEPTYLKPPIPGEKKKK